MTQYATEADGLSPRLRGNLGGDGPNDPRVRSIPAPAGEPNSLVFLILAVRVYPRACGGTAPGHNVVFQAAGLSPRLRGNRNRQTRDHQSMRSIPAPAGEPSPLSTILYPVPVYPRACGGTEFQVEDPDGDLGLSPRLRGNHAFLLVAVLGVRSIPAPAGEPQSDMSPHIPPLVYPRACGGEVRSSYVLPCRSIPAPAGEPPGMTHRRPKTTVYPRACGGTIWRGI